MFPRIASLALALVLSLAAFTWADTPKKVLLVGQGPDGHPPQTHEYMAGVKLLEKLLERAGKFDITVVRADGPWREGPELIERSDGVVFFVSEGAKWLQQDEKRFSALTRVAKHGGGVVGLHWAIGCKDAKFIDPFLQVLGACHGGPDRKYQELETDVSPAEGKHPILTGVEPFRVKDEFYYKLKVVKSEKAIQPLLLAKIDGANEMVSWAWERPDGGRSFGFSGLHFTDNWKLPQYRRLATQGVLWTLKLPVPEGGVPVDVKEAE
jgi:type 1 glutamine amidotransferase